MTDYERGYLDGQQNRDQGGILRAGLYDPQVAPPYTQGFVDGHAQRQGRIEDPR